MRRSSLLLLAAALVGATHVAGAVTTDQRDFCVRYAGHATSEAIVAERSNCAFTGPRWITDHDQHLNWCLSNFAAATDATGEVRARDFADAEDAARIAGIQECQAKNASGGGTAFTATATEDVDLYDRPGGNGNILGVLDQGSPVNVRLCQPDNWCQLTTNYWVWGDFLRR